MKNISLFIALSVFTLTSKAQSTLTFHDYSAISMPGDTIYMSQFYGKKVMVVNCASFCSYTPQYAPLQQLYSDYAQYNFEIIGFPSDDFLNQGGSDSDIINTCHDYGVTFLIMDKVHVATGNIAPVFQWLKQSSLNGVANASVTWNFNKFLIDEAGHWVKHYTQNTEPDDPAIVAWIVDTPSVVSGIIEKNTEDIIEMRTNNPGSSIEFVLKDIQPQNIDIGLYNIEGRLVKNVFSGIADNNQSILCDVSLLTSGIYFARITSKGIQQTLKYVAMK